MGRMMYIYYILVVLYYIIISIILVQCYIHSIGMIVYKYYISE